MKRLRNEIIVRVISLYYSLYNPSEWHTSSLEWADLLNKHLLQSIRFSYHHWYGHELYAFSLNYTQLLTGIIIKLIHIYSDFFTSRIRGTDSEVIQWLNKTIRSCFIFDEIHNDTDDSTYRPKDEFHYWIELWSTTAYSTSSSVLSTMNKCYFYVHPVVEWIWGRSHSFHTYCTSFPLLLKIDLILPKIMELNLCCKYHLSCAIVFHKTFEDMNHHLMKNIEQVFNESHPMMISSSTKPYDTHYCLSVAKYFHHFFVCSIHWEEVSRNVQDIEHFVLPERCKWNKTFLTSISWFYHFRT